MSTHIGSICSVAEQILRLKERPILEGFGRAGKKTKSQKVSIFANLTEKHRDLLYTLEFKSVKVSKEDNSTGESIFLDAHVINHIIYSLADDVEMTSYIDLSYINRKILKHWSPQKLLVCDII